MSAYLEVAADIEDVEMSSSSSLAIREPSSPSSRVSEQQLNPNGPSRALAEQPNIDTKEESFLSITSTSTFNRFQGKVAVVVTVTVTVKFKIKIN
ncbi:hypothetical protein DSL72_004654 [Monilinia vaccinii-corymbosi]|uniref:Uncharacterized protein n=1 Tax=Monilinia vaccinii-corymbosi TaxID=61207 RepID=A0A8A3P2S1_9HELO|nr:hypothetical protein DSL72_004654 [Monilinia vaccinii-corymbosi]